MKKTIIPISCAFFALATLNSCKKDLDSVNPVVETENGNQSILN